MSKIFITFISPGTATGLMTMRWKILRELYHLTKSIPMNYIVAT